MIRTRSGIRSLAGVALLSLTLVAAPLSGVGRAQSNTGGGGGAGGGASSTGGGTNTAATTRDDRGFDWGWLGLVGLLGLAGLSRRRDTTHHVHGTVSPRGA